MPYLPRSEWTDTQRAVAEVQDTITGIYIHYPGDPTEFGELTQEEAASVFRGFRQSHLDHPEYDWDDIAYNMGVDQAGRIWELRGMNRESHSQGTPETNRTGQSIVVLVGNTEEPTPAAIDAVNECIQHYPRAV